MLDVQGVLRIFKQLINMWNKSINYNIFKWTNEMEEKVVELEDLSVVEEELILAKLKLEGLNLIKANMLR